MNSLNKPICQYYNNGIDNDEEQSKGDHGNR